MSVRPSFLLLALASSSLLLAQGAGKAVLFDHTHYEHGGASAEWVICTASEPNPIPANPTKETDWNGGISALAFDLYKQGYKVQSLPASGGRITYGDTSNAQDLSKYHVFFIPECYTKFSDAEKTAIMKFVQNGGGLFLLGNHKGAARMSSSVPGSTDAFTVFNDLVTNNTVAPNGFGFTWVEGHGTGDARNTTSNAYTKAVNPATNAILRGPNGTCASQDFHSYAYLVINTANNPSAQGLLATQVPGDSPNYFFTATCTFGNGRVVVTGDSSPADDGTTNTSGKNLIDSYNLYSNRSFFLNAIAYLAGSTSGNKAPVVSITSPASTVTVQVGDTVAFQATASDPDGDALTHAWNFGDGGNATGLGPVSHTFATAGTFTTTHTATDTKGLSSTATRTVMVNPATGYTITASAGANGSISPSGAVAVAKGGSKSFTLTPNAGYKVGQLLVDGVNQGALTTYTFSNVTANHTIAATFTPATTTTLTENFDSGTKGSYTTGTVALATGSWTLNDALLGGTSADPRSGAQSVRMRYSGKLTMGFNFPSGAKQVTVKHAAYGSDASSTWSLWYSTNSGSTWTQTGGTQTAAGSTLQTATFTLNVTGPVRFEIRKTDGSSRRMNLDAFTIIGN